MIFHKAMGITQCIATFVSATLSQIMAASYLGLMRDTDTKAQGPNSSHHRGARYQYWILACVLHE